MAWTTGTCAGHLGFLDAMKTFLTANGWLCLADRVEHIGDTISTKPSNLDHRTLYFKGTGLAGLDEIYIGFQDWQFANLDAYNIAINGFTGFHPDASFFNQAGAMPLDSSKYNLCNTLSSETLTYWIHCNGRRVLWAVRVGASYVTGYAGLFLPFCRPDQYPYPMFVGGNCKNLAKRYSEQISENSNFYAVKSSQSPSIYFDSTWIKIASGGRYILTEKVSCFAHNLLAIYDYSCDFKGEFQLDILPNENKSRPLYPLQIISEQGFVGELDGIMVCNGTAVLPEDTIKDDDANTDWLLISNVFREGLQDYCAIALERTV